MRAKEGQNCTYELYGMIMHDGWLDAGHYTAVCYDSANGWVLFDDSRWRKISEKNAEMMAETAYVLFYRRKGVMR